MRAKFGIVSVGSCVVRQGAGNAMDYPERQGAITRGQRWSAQRALPFCLGTSQLSAAGVIWRRNNFLRRLVTLETGLLAAFGAGAIHAIGVEPDRMVILKTKPEVVSPYNQKFVLKQTLVDVECWNCTDGSTGTILAGTEIEVHHVHDSTSTTISVKSGPALVLAEPYIQIRPPCCGLADPGLMGLPLNRHADGSAPAQVLGYRFIVNNLVLGEAIGVPMLEKTRDLVGEIIAAESGELSDDELRDTIKALKADGSFRDLQGWWGRTAAMLGV